MVTRKNPGKNIPLPVEAPKKRGRGRPRLTATSPLTRKQELFVKELVSKDGQSTMRECAVGAGYAANSAHTRAYELTNPHLYPNVCAKIHQYRQELDEKYGINYKRHLRDLQRIRNEALQNGAYSAAVQAEYRRGQTGGLYVSKSEIRHGSIDSMSKEDVLRALDEIRNPYAPITTDITDVGFDGPDNASNRAKARGRLLEAVPDSVVEASESQETELDET